MKHNADTKGSDKKNQPPRQSSAYFKNLEVAKLLIEYNVDIEARVDSYSQIRQEPQQELYKKKTFKNICIMQQCRIGRTVTEF